MNFHIEPVQLPVFIIICLITITFLLMQEIGFTESFLNWETFTWPNFAQLPFLTLLRMDFVGAAHG